MKSKNVISEFQHLALYFPVHYALQNDLFSKYDTEIKTCSVAGNDKATYLALINQEATLALGDPIYTLGDHAGNAIAIIVEKNPFVLMSTDKNIHYGSVKEVDNITIGTYEESTTSYTLGSKLFGTKCSIVPYSYNTLSEALKSGEIDAAILLPEQQENNFYPTLSLSDTQPKLAFTTISALDYEDTNNNNGAALAVRDALNFILNNPTEALVQFTQHYPHIHAPEKAFAAYRKVWSKDGSINALQIQETIKTWSKSGPKVSQGTQIYDTKIQDILYSLTSRKFSRDYPRNFESMSKLVSSSVRTSSELSLLSFWGSGTKALMSDMDHDLIRYTQKLLSSIKKTGVTPNMTFILADTHGHMNGYDKKNVQSYLKEVESELGAAGMKIVYMSKLWDDWNLTTEKIKTKAQDISNITEQLLSQSAKNYRNTDPTEGAKLYLAMRTLEGPLIAQRYKDSILCSYTDDSARPFLPDMPTLYLFTVGKYRSAVPWFELA